MITWWQSIKLSLWAGGVAVMLIGAQSVHAQEAGHGSGHKKTSIELQLTESFYRALRAEDGKTYSTDPSVEYLRQIAVSSKFMVETNLKLIENQQRIIMLLESMQVPSTK